MKIGFFSGLSLLFIGLKLGGVIDWSWIWVLAPIWIPISIVFFITLLIGTVVVAAEVLKK